VLLVSWGSSQGPVQEAVKYAQAEGISVSGVHIKYVNPLPNGLDTIFSRFTHVLVVELNDEGIYGYGGQMASLLRARYCDPRITGLTKSDGLTWKIREILQKVHSLMAKA